MKRFDQMPVKMLVRAGSEGRDSDADPFTWMLGASRQLSDGESFHDAWRHRHRRFIENLQIRFDFHARLHSLIRLGSIDSDSAKAPLSALERDGMGDFPLRYDRLADQS